LKRKKLKGESKRGEAQLLREHKKRESKRGEAQLLREHKKGKSKRGETPLPNHLPLSFEGEGD